jgi:hypothetical protein
MLAGAGVLRTANAGVLEDFVDLLVGSFSSEAQAKQDARYDAITSHVAEIWAGDDPAERWLYTEIWMPKASAPYMQRVTHLRAGIGRFEGATTGSGCRNSYKGASYAISQSVLTADEMVNWDRGFNAAGELVWGSAAGGYQFRRVDAAVSPALPAPQSPR